jgi:hypothetical protein
MIARGTARMPATVVQREAEEDWGAMRNQDALAQVQRRHSRMQGPHRAPEKLGGASLSDARAETVEE